ncbi:uncharacterized protein LOC125679479 [Ostrea edulis]|uniref:uncharacterized protein LOC125679479 n=1 Tax=Ostrea edulis TaxID=37623 RepID=UPI0024AEAD0E|nr:uncharacterized protein LOC125679479 [Ostrea edulis]
MNDIPENPKDSFYNGHLYVTVKDKVFQASSPLRHSTESVSLMRQCYSDDDVNLRTPVLIRYTDGGPDHRTTYKSVKICALMEFIALDLDMIVCARTAPCGSYANPAERTMSLLNLALQNVALERTAMSPNCEMQIKSVNSLKSLRNLASKNQRIKEEYTQAVGATLNILKERFKRLSWKGESVCVQEAASQEEMNALVEILKVLDENIQSDSNLSNLQSKAVDAFLESHSRSRQYIFQIKKCLTDNCGYCVLNPPRLPDEVFQGLHFMPDPTKDENGQYKGFKDLYGTETNDMDRPSLKGKSGESSERDKKFKAVLVGTKVRGFVICTECGKRRGIYASRKLNRMEERAVERVQEELLYICGSPLFPGGQYQDIILCRQNIDCSSPIETQYYAGATQIFDAVCFHCGDSDVSNSEEFRRLQEDFAIVRPICQACLHAGKQISTRNAKKTQKMIYTHTLNPNK